MNDNQLDGLSIASPCSADWNQMQGDERRRFCAQCKLHVHDLSAMSRDEANALLQAGKQGRVCVRFFRRADGRVLTRDCPVGMRQQLRRAWARAVAMWLAVWGSASCVRPTATGTPVPPVVQPLQGEVKMGEVATPKPEPGPGKPEPRAFTGLVGPSPEPPKPSPEPPKK